MGDTYLITGGAGNLACQLTYPLTQAGHRCILMDVATAPVTEPAPGSTLVHGDVTSAENVSALFEKHKPTVVVHFATLLSGQSEEDRKLAWEVNSDGAFAVLETAVTHGVRRLFFPSSVASYGGDLPNPVPEDFPQWPIGLYGATKVAIERLGDYYYHKHGLDFRCVRVPVVISAYAPQGAASAYASRAFIDSVRTGEYTFRVRPETRPSLIYVKDVVQMVVDLLQAPAECLTQRVYNIQALAPTAKELADAIESRVPSARIRFSTDPDISRLIDSWPIELMDKSARQDWGWNPEFDLQTMADDFIEELTRESADPC